MKKMKIFAVAAVCASVIWSCAPKPLVVDFNKVPDNERCDYMKEVCREAERFQSQFETMSREEQQDARVILGAYVEQCEGAQRMCLATMD